MSQRRRLGLAGRGTQPLSPSKAQPDPDRRAGCVDTVHQEHGRAEPIIPSAKDAAGDDDVHRCQTIFVPSNQSPAQTTVDSPYRNTAPAPAFLAIPLHSSPSAEFVCVSLTRRIRARGRHLWWGMCEAQNPGCSPDAFPDTLRMRWGSWFEGYIRWKFANPETMD